ncbi:hypothetical protein XELAEV_18005213mg [Xenopus laevis]|uniref:Uncharacterized protein n=1 Tax=Xenopus laevis TaxID=8355 RepID=A0A974DWW1_XENLA|nr:hypothetical protein XELAEV_18005213mg [Xenopus laevis]
MMQKPCIFDIVSILYNVDFTLRPIFSMYVLLCALLILLSNTEIYQSSKYRVFYIISPNMLCFVYWYL